MSKSVEGMFLPYLFGGLAYLLSRSFFLTLFRDDKGDRKTQKSLDFRRSYEINRRAHPSGWAYLG